MDLENGRWTSRILEFRQCEGQKPLETSGKCSDHLHQQILETSLTPQNGRSEETSAKHFHGEFQGKVAFHF